jgi:DNA invertase Pin-like site-specific DNA recombinase
MSSEDITTYKLVMVMLWRFSERSIKEPTHAGLAAARARGRIGGRKPGLSEGAQRKARIAESYYREGMPVNQIGKDLNISKATLYKYLRLRGVEISPYQKYVS